MNKEEILDRIKAENQYGDERKRHIDRVAKQNSLTAITSISMVLAFLALIQEQLTGQSFADWYVFGLVIFGNYSCEYITKYHYYRDRNHLITAIFFCTVSFIAAMTLLENLIR